MLFEAFDSKSVDEVMYEHILNIVYQCVPWPFVCISIHWVYTKSYLWINMNPQDKEPKVQATQPSTKEPLELKSNASYMDNVFEESIVVESIANIHEP